MPRFKTASRGYLALALYGTISVWVALWLAGGALCAPQTRLKFQEDWYIEKHDDLVQRAHQGPCDLLFVGDSITEYWLTEGKGAWEREYVPLHAVNLGIAGDTTDDVLWRLSHGEIEGLKPKVTILLIGTNDISLGTEAGISDKVKKILDLLLKKMPQTKVLLLGIFPRDWSANSPSRKTVSQVNERLAGLADKKNVFYLDMGKEFLGADGSIHAEIMPDALHLSTEGYRIWVRAMGPELRRLLND